MKIQSRYCFQALLEDPLAKEKMAFLSGPRQSGKTTLARALLEETQCPENYFNWDDPDFARTWIRSPKSILERISVPEKGLPVIVLDELHKYRKWKNTLKGFYDLYQKRIRILVTGSAKLNVYQKSGDSLAGRYIPYRLHPFSVGEVNSIKPPPKENWFENQTSPRFAIQDLLELGGFPEPLLGGKQELAERWWRLYRDQIIREDFRDFKQVREIRLVGFLLDLLLTKVGGGLSYQSLQEDLKVAFDTIRSWIEVFESLYICFLIRPYSKKIQGALRKEPKVYFYHNPAVPTQGSRLENLIATHLLKNVHAWTDAGMGAFELHYIRDKYKREVDFCVTQNGKPWLLLEVKSRSKGISPALRYYTDLLKPSFSFQLAREGDSQRKILTEKGQIELVSPEAFLSAIN